MGASAPWEGSLASWTPAKRTLESPSRYPKCTWSSSGSAKKAPSSSSHRSWSKARPRWAPTTASEIASMWSVL